MGWWRFSLFLCVSFCQERIHDAQYVSCGVIIILFIGIAAARPCLPQLLFTINLNHHLSVQHVIPALNHLVESQNFIVKVGAHFNIYLPARLHLVILLNDVNLAPAISNPLPDKSQPIYKSVFLLLCS